MSRLRQDVDLTSARYGYSCFATQTANLVIIMRVIDSLQQLQKLQDTTNLTTTTTTSSSSRCRRSGRSSCMR